MSIGLGGGLAKLKTTTMPKFHHARVKVGTAQLSDNKWYVWLSGPEPGISYFETKNGTREEAEQILAGVAAFVRSNLKCAVEM
jgi:hypothetical protein